MMIWRAFAMALAQMRDPSFRRVLWLGLALAVALLFAMYAILLMVIQAFTPDSLTLPLVGEVGGIATLLSLGSIVFVLGLSVFLMVPVASAFTGLFLDDVADAVEARHYPALAGAPRASFWSSLVDGVQYFGLLLGLNLLGLAVFALSGGVGIIVFWAINGFLLAREYFTLVALRRLSREEAATMRKRHGFRLWLAGTLMAVPLSVPVINLVVPVMGAAVFTHLYHLLSAREAGRNPDRQHR
jgi:CysZ protein